MVTHAIARATNEGMRRNFVRALAAVLSGATIYILLWPHLPRVAQHQVFREDLGLLIYALISLVIYLGIIWVDRK
jgi:hypothetical protein